MLELRAKDRVEANTLDHIIGTYLAQFVKDVAQETLRAGLLAKKRAEDEVTTADGRVLYSPRSVEEVCLCMIVRGLPRI